MKPVKEIKYFLVILLAAAGMFISGCSKEKHEPEDINELAEVYAELVVAREMYAAAKDSTSLNESEDSVYAKFGYTREGYDKEIKSIEPNSAVWEDFFKHANKHLDSLKAVDKRK